MSETRSNLSEENINDQIFTIDLDENSKKTQNEPEEPKILDISTPKKNDEVPLSNALDAVDLNIVNLESTSDVRLDDRARSSPSVILVS